MKKTFFLISYIWLSICLAGPVFAAKEAVVVVSCAGRADVVPDERTGSVGCVPGMLLNEGAKISTGEESYVFLAFDRSKNNTAKAGGNSETVLGSWPGYMVELLTGDMTVSLKDPGGKRVFRVKTPETVCAAKKSGWNIKTGGGVTTVSVLEGKVIIRGLNDDGSALEGEVTAEGGYEVKIERSRHPGLPERIPPERLENRKKAFGAL
ncbi:MAG: FecR domain-containing protein [Candidatus Omnitrophota bacterium]